MCQNHKNIMNQPLTNATIQKLSPDIEMRVKDVHNCFNREIYKGGGEVSCYWKSKGKKALSSIAKNSHS